MNGPDFHAIARMPATPKKAQALMEALQHYGFRAGFYGLEVKVELDAPVRVRPRPQVIQGLHVYACLSCRTLPSFSPAGCRCRGRVPPLTQACAVAMLRDFGWTATNVAEFFNDRDVSADPLVVALREVAP